MLCGGKKSGGNTGTEFLCRNVIIYFKDEVKQKIIEDFIKSLKVGGLLFVGATESINTYKTSGLEKLSPFIYKKI